LSIPAAAPSRVAHLDEARDGLIAPTLGDYEGDIVALFVRAELPNVFRKGGK
jgi:hypothetical protein